MEDIRFEPRVIETPFGKIKMCALEFCKQEHDCRGLCKAHYMRLREGRPLGPIPRHLDYPPCVIDWCPRESLTKAKAGLCKAHYQQQYRGLIKELGDYYEPTPYDANWNADRSARACKTCEKLKPVEEFYRRNQHRAPGTETRSTQCKTCYRTDVAYYAGKLDKKANGTDPMDWAQNPEAQEERRLRSLADNRERMAKKLKEKKNENV